MSVRHHVAARDDPWGVPDVGECFPYEVTDALVTSKAIRQGDTVAKNDDVSATRDGK